MDKIQATTARELSGRRKYLRWRDAYNSQGAGERGEERRGEEESQQEGNQKPAGLLSLGGCVCWGGGMRTWTTHPRCHCD